MKITNLKNFETLLYTAAVLFSIFYVVILHSALGGGFIAGADWNNPATKQQYNRSLEVFTSTWADNWYLGARNSTHTNLWYILFTTTLSHILTDLTLIPVIVIVLTQVLALVTTYWFLKDLGKSKPSALLAGIFLATSPIFFNYLTMGWIYVLMAFSFLNLSLLFIRRGLMKGKTSNILLAGVFFGLSFAQSQAILWIPLVVTSYVLFENLGNIGIKRKFLAIVLFLFTGILINAPTVLEIIFVPNRMLLSNTIVTTGASVGASVYATPINLIRLLGSGFNSQYETSQEGVLFTLVSFLLPLLLITLLINRNKDRASVIMGFFLLLFVPVTAYIIGGNRELMAKIPGSAIFRDVARFSFVSTYASAILLGIFLDQAKKYTQPVKQIVYLLVVLWLSVAILPWLNGALIKQPARSGPDVRLRSVVYPEDYFNLEEKLSSDTEAYRVLFLPAGGSLDITNDRDFNGAYREMQDIFAGYSPSPGGLWLNDRPGKLGKSFSGILVEEVTQSRNPDILDYLIITSTKYVVLKLNTKFTNKIAVISSLDSLVRSGEARLYYEGKDIKAYEILYRYPYIYNPEAYATSSHAVYTDEAKISFVKEAPYKYTVTASNTTGAINMVLSESYDDYWQIQKVKTGEPNKGRAVDLSKHSTHYIAKNYANGWTLNVDALCAENDVCTQNIDGSYNINLEVVHTPQKIYNAGVIITVIILLGTILVCFLDNSGMAERKKRTDVI